jgi:hypothetical protein
MRFGTVVYAVNFILDSFTAGEVKVMQNKHLLLPAKKR